MAESDVYIALGSNVEPERHIPSALAALTERYGALSRSPAYRSAPIGFDGPDFVNCIAGFRSETPPEDLIRHLKSLETLAGRRKERANASRELDLDLILYGDAVITREGLLIPRPDILRYPFVLRPLAELAPERVHPQTRRTFAWHWEHFAGEPAALEPFALE